ncbi:hypothetical protein GUITHDRAFT_148425 [Guillardia theta CCMP2712]|uniref:PIF1/LRR1 pleckstrin homology domain-containing protein n=4 Tax=Guillardia theta TaxID=55529 RepID=L1I900_GUITC|nr:hypothetical protein GUITHDRAFT_148425 [Guillardia theta CCMP2712]EKX32708.1 hypothetical protein GUITHDRAFT_148425 [Guillardia theta CCMP2712]|eukprot:XP_005819688.1 hypothetical protein GUITHDRAFT_148425 [Guillardia theta CCMP2712]
MKIACDVYIEPIAPKSPASQDHKPLVLTATHVSVDRNDSRDICVFIETDGGGGRSLACKVEDLSDLDSKKLPEGCLGLRFSSPPVQVMLFNARAILLQDLLRLLKKLTEKRRVGSSLRFRFTPLEVLQADRDKTGIAGEPRGAARLMQGRDASQSSRPEMTLSSEHSMHEPPYLEDLSRYEKTEPFKVHLEHEIEGLRQAMEDDLRGRSQLQEKISRLERENLYLTNQLKMEQSLQSELKQTASGAQAKVKEVEQKLKEKMSELQLRTEELMEARSGHEQMIDTEMKRLALVDSRLNQSGRRLKALKKQLGMLLLLRRQERMAERAIRSLKVRALLKRGRRRLLRVVHERSVRVLLGKPLVCWQMRAQRMATLRVFLPAAAERRRRKLMTSCLSGWKRGCWSLRGLRVEEEVRAARSMFEQQEKELKSQLKDAREMIDDLREELARKDSLTYKQACASEQEILSLQESLRRQQDESARLHTDNEEKAKQLRIAENAEKTGRVVLEEKEEELVKLRERVRAAEEAYDRVRAKLQEELNDKRDLEDVLSRRDLMAGDRHQHVQHLEGTVADLEQQCQRLLQQVQAEEAARYKAEEMRMRMQERLEAFEQGESFSHDSLRVQHADTQNALERERARSEELEDALSKLVEAFKEGKRQERMKLIQAGQYVRLLSSFFSWRRCADQQTIISLSAPSGFGEARQTPDLSQELLDLKHRNASLQAMLAEAKAGGEEERRRREELERQVMSLKETYLQGVKASVQSIRLCRDRYLPANGQSKQ